MSIPNYATTGYQATSIRVKVGDQTETLTFAKDYTDGTYPHRMFRISDDVFNLMSKVGSFVKFEVLID